MMALVPMEASLLNLQVQGQLLKRSRSLLRSQLLQQRPSRRQLLRQRLSQLQLLQQRLSRLLPLSQQLSEDRPESLRCLLPVQKNEYQ